MNFSSSDTIAALSTPAGKGAISIIRITGPGCFEAVSSICKSRRSMADMKNRTAFLVDIVDGPTLIDRGLLTLFRAPGSYTGEDLAEISFHGNPLIAGQILEALYRITRAALPGEFTRRAFLNGKIDLIQAEAIGDLIEAPTRGAQLSALSQLKGGLSNRLKEVSAILDELRSIIVYAVDFADEEEEIESRATPLLDALISELEDLIMGARDGQILREGLKVVLLGPPNAGKSSIFNALYRSQRAIVTPHPGTTRDYLEETISVQGIAIRLFDTAGLRETVDPVEKEGVNHALRLASEADWVLYVFDASEESSGSTFLEGIAPKKTVRVANKCDLCSDSQIRKIQDDNFIPCSTVAPNGTDPLVHFLKDNLPIFRGDSSSGLITNARCLSAVRAALDALLSARNAFSEGCEFVHFELDQAGRHLGEITGHTTTDDLLDRVFSRFCIGK